MADSHLDTRRQLYVEGIRLGNKTTAGCFSSYSAPHLAVIGIGVMEEGMVSGSKTEGLKWEEALRLRMKGTIPLCPCICLHGIVRDNFIFFKGYITPSGLRHCLKTCRSFLWLSGLYIVSEVKMHSYLLFAECSGLMKSAKYFQSPEKNLLEGTVPLHCNGDVFSITLGIVTALMTDAFCKHVNCCTKAVSVLLSLSCRKYITVISFAN